MLTCPMCKKKLRGLERECLNCRTDVSLLVDMSGLAYIDSTGLGVLVGALKQAREMGGDVRLRSLNPQAYNVFDITGLTRVFTIEE